MTYSSFTNGHIPFDYHMHSNISWDSRATMAEMCQSALQQGIHEIAFTEHFDIKSRHTPPDYYRPDRYFENLAAVRDAFTEQGLTIRAGIEVGEVHRFRDRVQDVLDAWPYDVVLGSLHWSGEESVFDQDYFRAHPAQDTIPIYFEELAEMARGGGFDVLAHPDVFKRNALPVYGHFDITQWEEYVRPVWQACIDNGIAVELNSSALRSTVHQLHPSPESLRWYHEMGGELLTIGSDSHRPDHVGADLTTALDCARQAGFTRLCRFEQRQVAGWIEI